jgi:hypothetical protein
MWKDVECCFVVFKTKFQIIANLRKQGSKEVIADVLMACVALCNMIIENEGQILNLAWHDHNKNIGVPYIGCWVQIII